MMNNPDVLIHEDNKLSVPDGLCQCGCGRPTPKSRFIHGHGGRKPSLERFNKFLVRDRTSGCLNWIGYKDEKGYGRFWINGSLQKPHRIAFINAGGKLTEDKPHVCHRCDNPSCCEPSHLFAGNYEDNARDKARKGRGRKSTKTGLPYGVCFWGNRFGAHVRFKKVLYRLGVFDTIAEAHAVAMRFKADLR